MLKCGSMKRCTKFHQIVTQPVYCTKWVFEVKENITGLENTCRRYCWSSWDLVSKGSCRNLIWRDGVSQGRDLAERGGRSLLASSAACISILSPSQKIVNLCNHGVGSVQSFCSNVSRSQSQCWLHLWSDMSCTMHNVACMTPDARLIKASASPEHKGSVGNNRPLFLSQWHNSWWWPPSTSDATLCISTGEDAQSQGGAYYASVFMHMRWC